VLLPFLMQHQQVRADAGFIVLKFDLYVIHDIPKPYSLHGLQLSNSHTTRRFIINEKSRWLIKPIASPKADTNTAILNSSILHTLVCAKWLVTSYDILGENNIA